MSRRAGFCTAWALLGGLLLLVESPVLAGMSFFVSPLSADHTAVPGASVRDRLVVVNNAEEPASFSITVQDFTTDVAGRDAWQPVGSHPRSLGDWIAFTPSFLTLPPRGKGYIEYEIQVPRAEEGGPEALPPEGSYWAALLVRTESERQARQELPEGQKLSGFGVNAAFVYAIKIYLSIEGTERPSLEAVGLQAGQEPGSLVATFTNTGNVILRPRVWMEVRDLEGAVLLTLDSLKWTLQPGTRRSDFPKPAEDLARYLLGHLYTFSLRDLLEPLPDGRYQVAVIADYGGPRLLGLMAPLNLNSPGEP